MKRTRCAIRFELSAAPPGLAAWAADVARRFRDDHPDLKPGQDRAVVYKHGGRTAMVWWTAKRAITVDAWSR
jgi:hypothetical protein